MLTGDKLETAICIAKSSRLVSRDQAIHIFQQVIILIRFPFICSVFVAFNCILQLRCKKVWKYFLNQFRLLFTPPRYLHYVLCLSTQFAYIGYKDRSWAILNIRQLKSYSMCYTVVINCEVFSFAWVRVGKIDEPRHNFFTLLLFHILTANETRSEYIRR